MLFLLIFLHSTWQLILLYMLLFILCRYLFLPIKYYMFVQYFLNIREIIFMWILFKYDLCKFFSQTYNWSEIFLWRILIFCISWTFISCMNKQNMLIMFQTKISLHFSLFLDSYIYTNTYLVLTLVTLMRNMIIV